MAKVWDRILQIKPEPLSTLKGRKGEHTDLYKRLTKKEGVYVIRDSKCKIVYIGIAGRGPKDVGRVAKEAGLADRLWGHNLLSSDLNKRLKEIGLRVDQCTVAVYPEEDAKKRRRAEMYGIAVCDPFGNVD